MNRLLVLVLLQFSVPSLAIQRFEGELPGALGRFAIDVPADWQPGGRLIVYNHGFSMRFPTQVEHINTAPNGPFRDYLLDRGYALAAASYATRGWAMFDMEREQAALLAEFKRRAGNPGEILLFGGSLGGLVSLKTAEQFVARGEPVGGVYALCPPLAGARTWDAAVDTRLLFDAVCTSSPLPDGSTTLPWVLDYSAIPPNLSDLTDGSTLESALPIANRIRQCMGFYQPNFFDTSSQLQRRAKLKSLLGISSDDFLLNQIAYAVYPLADLIQAPEKLAGRNAFDFFFNDTATTETNARVLRVARDPLAAARLRAVSDLRGPFGNARMLVLHTERDELVVPSHLEVLDGLGIAPDRLSVALARQSGVAHCDFSGSELLAGFESLRRWIDGGAQPDADSLRVDCETRRGVSGDRCDFARNVPVAPLDERIRPRNLPIRPIAARHSGSWFDTRFDGEGLLIEILNQGRDALVGWYTYPPSGADGEQRWIVGLGRVTEDGIYVAEAYETRGARFNAFDPNAVQIVPWGELTLAFGGCEQPAGGGQGLPGGQLRLGYRGPAAYGSGERVLTQLTQNAVNQPLCAEVGIPPLPSEGSRYAGSWARLNAPGDGWVLQVGADSRALLGWYTYDPQGRPAWLVGIGEFDEVNRRVRLDLQRTRGARFGSAFRPLDVQRIEWGELRLEFDSCSRARAAWTPVEGGWSPGSAVLERITQVDGTPECRDQ